MKRWRVKWAGLYAIVFPFGFHTHLAEYPAILRHLTQFEADLRKRGQCVSSRRGEGKGQHHWLELDNNPKPTYLAEFTKPKVIIPAIERGCAFAFDGDGDYSNDKTTICVSDEARFLCAVLNSSVVWWIIRQVAAERQNGYYEFKPMYVNALPIPASTPADRNTLTALVDRILKAKQANAAADTSAWEREIDERVYRLYGLTPDDIRLVEEAAPSSRPVRKPHLTRPFGIEAALPSLCTHPHDHDGHASLSMQPPPWSPTFHRSSWCTLWDPPSYGSKMSAIGACRQIV